MSDCMGAITVSTKTDRAMADFLQQQAEELGVTRAELVRRLFDHLQETEHGELVCPYCENELRLDI